MFQELDTVVLTHHVENHGLKEGDIGVVVHCYQDGQGLEVEFVTAEEKTIALLTLTPSDVRLMREREILHVRELSAA